MARPGWSSRFCALAVSALLALARLAIAPAPASSAHIAAERAGAGPALRRSLRHLQQSREEKANAAYCATGNFTDLYQTIEDDLRYWREGGISAELTDYLVEHWKDFPWRLKGVGIAFVGGKPFIITDVKDFDRTAHHKSLIVAHLALFEALSRAFGAAIPEVEFLVSTADEPTTLIAKYQNSTRPPGMPPILRFCKANPFADILVPDIHFFTRNFTTSLLERAHNFSAAWPWARKNASLFGRFSPYSRFVNKGSMAQYREGMGGANICVVANPELYACSVRKHYIWSYVKTAQRQGLPVDVAQQPKKDMLHHASHKYLLHLDGQSCSSRLEQLLVLGSAVVKEESGYRAFFHHLLQPYKHYIPFWKKRPEETADALAWAADHDGEAAQIAASAQRLALQYLHRRALMCYWLTLLKELSGLLRYKVGPEAGRTYRHWTPLDEYMRAEGDKELEKKRLQHMEFWD